MKSILKVASIIVWWLVGLVVLGMFLEWLASTFTGSLLLLLVILFLAFAYPVMYLIERWREHD